MSVFKEAVKITVILVALFLLVRYARGASQVGGTVFKGWGGLIRDFQGRGQY